jgi:hypothetical protein
MDAKFTEPEQPQFNQPEPYPAHSGCAESAQPEMEEFPARGLIVLRATANKALEERSHEIVEGLVGAASQGNATAARVLVQLASGDCGKLRALKNPGPDPILLLEQDLEWNGKTIDSTDHAVFTPME